MTYYNNNLKKDINRLNNIRDNRNPDGVSYREERYCKQKPRIYDGKRNFVDIDQYPQNNCRINKQIQMESHILFFFLFLIYHLFL